MIIYDPSRTAFYVVSDFYKSVDIANFAKGGEIGFSSPDLRGERLDGDNQPVVEKIFRKPGRYEIYVADNIETEPENALSAKLVLTYRSSR